jgi:anti-anti-sigma factor
MLDHKAYALRLTLRGPYAVVVAEGELDIAAVADLRARARRAAERTGRVVVDLRDVSFMDTFALRALLGLQHETTCRSGCSFHVVPGDDIQRVLDLTGMRHVLRWISAEQLAV